MTPIEKISIFARSPSWKSCFKREFAGKNLSWALDIDGLLKEVAQFTGRAVVVELTADTIADDCRRVFLASNQANQTRFFAVGDIGLTPWLPLIRVCGFADCCLSIGDQSGFVSRISTHFKTLADSDQTMEERIIERLPWRPARIFDQFTN